MRTIGKIVMGFLCAAVINVVSTYAEERQDIIDGNIFLQPITVTASRGARRVLESPAGISILSAQEIARSNADSVSDLLKNSAGVYTYDYSGVGTAGVVNMRGFYGGMSSHQLVLVDGIPQNKGKDKLVDWDLISLDNIESVEVVRGPVSALYGDNAMSGVINIITKKQEEKPEGKVYASYGSFNTQEYRVSVSGAYKKLGMVLGASEKITDGFRRHCDYDRAHIDLKLDYNINDGQGVRFLLDRYEKKRGAFPWALSENQIAQDRRQARTGTENDKSEETKNDLSFAYNWEISNKINTETTVYYKYNEADSFYTSGSTESTKKEQLEDEDTYGVMLKTSLNQEVMGLVHGFTAGIDLERDEFDYGEYKAPYQQRGELQSDYGVKRDKIGPYIQDEIKLSDFLRVIGGARYDCVDFDFADDRNNLNSKENSMDEITQHYGIVYTYQKSSNLYANYAQAFRAATIGQMFTYGSSANSALKPEEAVNYELGLRHRLNESLNTNISLYWMELDNEIWYDYATRKYENYGETSHKGIETGLDFRVVKWLSGFANYSYSRAKNETGDYSGEYLTNIPLHKAGSGLHFATGFGLSWDISLTYVGSSYIDSANDNKLSGYSIVDTKFLYAHNPWSVFLAIDNLLNKKYNAYGYKSGNTKYYTPAPAMTFNLGGEIKF